MAELMIDARGLSKSYGSFRALDDVHFQIRKGEIVGFLGPNGAGKTTTMKILTCYIAPSEGTAIVGGADIWEDPLAVRAAIGYLPESTPLYGDMLVAEYLEFVGEMRGLQRAALRQAIRRVVEACDLGSFYGQEIRTLSKGQKQRVGLAQALIHEPPILILDEPMSGLDPNQAVEIRELIRELGKERTVILSTHNLAEVQVTCQRVLIISRGKIVADDTPQALSGRGQNRYIVVVEGAGNRAKAQEILSRIEGVAAVRELEVRDGEVRFEVLSGGKQDLRASISRTIVQGGLTLLELRPEGRNLEAIFRELTVGSEFEKSGEGEEGKDHREVHKETKEA